MASLSADLDQSEPRLWQNIRSISWGLVLLICAAAGCGIAVLYSRYGLQNLPFLLPILLTLAFLIAASRIILGMHFLSDVLAGSALGLALGLASFRIFTIF